MEKHGQHIKGQMLRKLTLYPKKISDLSGPVHAIPKRINVNISKVPHRIFFFSGLRTSSMNGFCKNWKWLVFLLSKSQST